MVGGFLGIIDPSISVKGQGHSAKIRLVSKNPVNAAKLKNSFVYTVHFSSESKPMGLFCASPLLGDVSQRLTSYTVTKSQPCLTQFSIFVVSSAIFMKFTTNTHKVSLVKKNLKSNRSRSHSRSQVISKFRF